MESDFQADVREVAETLYLFEKPLQVDHQKYVQKFGDTITTHEVALAQTLAWYRQYPQAHSQV